MPRRVLRVSPTVSGVETASLREGLAAVGRELGTPAQFSPGVLAEAESSASAPTLPEQDRTDLELVTIDPASSRDLDQALHLERRSGGFRVHYAIADVGAFVRPGGLIDAEAHQRGETLYGVGDKVPLHPPVISEGACSLLPDGPRPALLWTIDLDSEGERIAVRVERAMVRSRAKLSYAGVQADLDAGKAAPMLSLLREVGELRLERERARGGISLPLPDQEVELVDGRWQLLFRTPLPVEAWNAQISLLTGMAAAHLMTSARIGVLRTLAPADPRDLAGLRRVAAALGVSWPSDLSYPDLVRLLDPAHPRDAALLTTSTRLLRGSAYAAFDGSLPEQSGHSAIAAPYSHVTAPLRRLVDRYGGEVCVAVSAGVEVPSWARERLPSLPEEMQASARRANAYERGVLNLVEAVVLAPHVGSDFSGAVVQVADRQPTSGTIMVTEPAVEARLTSTTGPLSLGEQVTARLVQADPVTRKVRFEVA